MPLLLALADILDGVSCPLQISEDLFCLILVAELDLLVVPRDQLRRKRPLLVQLRQLGRDRPVFFRHEGLNLALAVADESDRDRLNPSRAQVSLYFGPEQRAELIAYETIENPSRLLGIDQSFIHVLRMLQRLLHCMARDLVEGDTFCAPKSQCMSEVPGNGFSFTVRVGGEVDLFGLRCGALQM